MTATRRRVLALGGGVIVTLAWPAVSRAETLVTIEMRGTARGERVWFAPIGLAVAPGTRLAWTNRDAGNSHTATAYHPDNGRGLRIPAAAAAWDSGLLLPGESFGTVLTAPGVYDYFCQPHEMAGMVGRIVVGAPDSAGWQDAAPPSDDLPEAAAAAFPSVAEILRAGRVETDG